MTPFLRFASFWRSSSTQIGSSPLFLTKLVCRLYFVLLQILLKNHSLGHRVATQYILSALEGSIPAEHLLRYREANSKLPGHPELGLTPGVKFSSGRLGHMWYVFDRSYHNLTTSHALQKKANGEWRCSRKPRQDPVLFGF